MAKSQYEYVKKFEEIDSAIPNCWLVVRIDGKGFHKYVQESTHPYANQGLQSYTITKNQMMQQDYL